MQGESIRYSIKSLMQMRMQMLETFCLSHDETQRSQLNARIEMQLANGNFKSKAESRLVVT